MRREFTMSKYVAIVNNGVIDVRSLELIGATSKKGDEGKIGLFGSGTKYAIAQCLRNGIDLYVAAGEKLIGFDTKDEIIGNLTHKRIRYVVDLTQTIETSMTTSMGAEDWNDPWYIVREFVSNAVDEGDYIVKLTDNVTPIAGKTAIYIEATPEIKSIVENMERFFKITDDEPLSQSSYGAAYCTSGPKCRVFKKGVYVRELSKPGMFDYSINNLRLTESRTCDQWDAIYYMVYVLDHLEVEQKADLLKNLAHRDDNYWIEGDCNMKYNAMKSNHESWKQAFEMAFPKSFLIPHNARIRQMMEERGHNCIVIPLEWETFMREVGVPTESDVLGEKAKDGFIEVCATNDQLKIIKKAQKILGSRFPESIYNLSHQVYGGDSDVSKNVLGYAIKKDGQWVIGIKDTVLEDGVRATVNVLLEEYCHAVSGFSDSCREFQDYIFDMLTKEICRGKV